MMKTQKWLVIAGVAAALCMSAGQSMAQDNGGRGGRGGFDPAQMQQRMMERYKEALEITSDDEWKALQPLVQKVAEARFSGMRGMFGGMPSRRS